MHSRSFEEGQGKRKLHYAPTRTSVREAHHPKGKDRHSGELGEKLLVKAIGQHNFSELSSVVFFKTSFLLLVIRTTIQFKLKLVFIFNLIFTIKHAD